MTAFCGVGDATLRHKSHNEKTRKHEKDQRSLATSQSPIISGLQSGCPIIELTPHAGPSSRALDAASLEGVSFPLPWFCGYHITSLAEAGATYIRFRERQTSIHVISLHKVHYVRLCTSSSQPLRPLAPKGTRHDTNEKVRITSFPLLCTTATTDCVCPVLACRVVGTFVGPLGGLQCLTTPTQWLVAVGKLATFSPNRL